IRDFHVTGVQTCALPISRSLQVAENPDLQQPTIEAPAYPTQTETERLWPWQLSTLLLALTTLLGFGLWLHARSQPAIIRTVQVRSEERRVGRERRSWSLP